MIEFFKISDQPPLILYSGINIIENREIIQQLIKFIKLLSGSRNLNKKDYLPTPVTRGNFYEFGWSTDAYHSFRYYILDDREQLEFNNNIIVSKKEHQLVEIDFSSDIIDDSVDSLLDTEEDDQKLFIPRALPQIFNFKGVKFDVGYLSSYSETNLCPEQIEKIEILVERFCNTTFDKSKQYLRSLFEKLTRTSEVSVIIETDPQPLGIKYTDVKNLILGEPGYGLLPNFQFITRNKNWRYSVR